MLEIPSENDNGAPVAASIEKHYAPRVKRVMKKLLEIEAQSKEASDGYLPRAAKPQQQKVFRELFFTENMTNFEDLEIAENPDELRAQPRGFVAYTEESPILSFKPGEERVRTLPKTPGLGVFTPQARANLQRGLGASKLLHLCDINVQRPGAEF